MSKKTIIQFVVSIIFFSITAYVMYGFFVGDTDKDGGGDSITKSSASQFDVKSLLNRSFKTEQMDVFDRDDFKKLKDNSVEIETLRETRVGRENPFEPID